MTVRSEAQLTVAAWRAFITAWIAFTIVFAVPVDARAAVSGDLASYQIGPGDRLTISVFGQADLSGDFIVDGAGNVSYPLLGSVSVASLTLAEAQVLVARRLANGFLRQPSVSVRLSEPRPIQVIGDVRTPGIYPYIYGGIVKTAIAQAGGTILSQDAPGATVANFLQADERVRVLSGQRRLLMVREARLVAQQQGREAFEISPAIIGSDRPEEVKSLVDRETDVLVSLVKAHKKQIEVIEAQRPQFEQELRSLHGQVESEKRQLALVGQQIESYEKLVKQGLGRTNSRIEFQLAEAARQTNIWRLDGDQSRVRNQIVDLEIRLQDLKMSYQRQLIAELQDTRSRLQEIEISLASAQEIRKARLQEIGGNQPGEAAYSIIISRGRFGQVRTIVAEESTRLEPGDIVDLKRLLPRNRAVRPLN